ncbi:RrF2 family transcriptional regulator [Robiginitomaculum antarcticum]|uniref:RrF2 family transcriptional regulator n=1 Tax=Robiginitomaculum antarcticum TaxID=437507 RepID=UPI00036E75DD|nr:Rrf2 family transcriptional regulator [Robiginitomaculum antarcticum]
MNITTFSDYALRVLIYLTTSGEGKVSAAQIATRYDISFHHVAKAAQWLSREGYIVAERGRGGGMRLARDPEDINIGAVLRQSEAGSALVECLREDGGACCIAPACGLQHALAEAQAAFYGALDAFTLVDVTAQKSALQTLLMVNSAD